MLRSFKDISYYIGCVITELGKPICVFDLGNVRALDQWYHVARSL